jgi:hypothetical protein
MLLCQTALLPTASFEPNHSRMPGKSPDPEAWSVCYNRRVVVVGSVRSTRVLHAVKFSPCYLLMIAPACGALAGNT